MEDLLTRKRFDFCCLYFMKIIRLRDLMAAGSTNCPRALTSTAVLVQKHCQLIPVLWVGFKIYINIKMISSDLLRSPRQIMRDFRWNNGGDDILCNLDSLSWRSWNVPKPSGDCWMLQRETQKGRNAFVNWLVCPSRFPKVKINLHYTKYFFQADI